MLDEWDFAYEISPEEFEIAIRAKLAVGPAPMIGDAVTDAGQSPTRCGHWMLAHVAQRGDILANPEQWAGVRESGLAIEGFKILPIPEQVRHEIRYRALLADRIWSEWVSAGDFCGSRGQGQLLFGYEAQLQGYAKWQLDLWCSARFIDGKELTGDTRVIGVADGGCLTPSGAPLEAIRILVSERPKRSQNIYGYARLLTSTDCNFGHYS